MRNTTAWRPPHYPCTVTALCVDGAKAAVEFYQAAFGAEVEHLVMHPGNQGKVMHASIRIGPDSMLFVSDPFPEWGSRPSVVGVRVYVPDADAAFKRAVKAGATVKQEPAESATDHQHPHTQQRSHDGWHAEADGGVGLCVRSVAV